MNLRWKSIEQAPRTGQPILACNTEHYAPETVYWASYHPNAIGKECWRTSPICGDKREGLTHYMDMLEPPR